VVPVLARCLSFVLFPVQCNLFRVMAAFNSMLLCDHGWTFGCSGKLSNLSHLYLWGSMTGAIPPEMYVWESALAAIREGLDALCTFLNNAADALSPIYIATVVEFSLQWQPSLGD
jgi:hypothetical protein